eukprot:TRINITY_DN1823_c1_g2_i1.p1 TRINITY_DN1823_c1_g2~~TRINITY_DN1823_c1_g2_i1.p1  ORF type:complete len:309 (+),score=31.11 TRINITY_DN1823_c1_g2_i1:293-1219(+)
MYYCFKACDEGCNGLGACMGACCFPDDRPSLVFPWVAVIVNSCIMLIGGLRFMGEHTTGCDEPVRIMMALALGAAAVHILFSLYFWKRLDVVMHRGGDTDTEALRMVKYDYGVFAYLLVCVGNGVLFIMSIVQKNDEDSCEAAASTVFYMWLFLVLYIMFLSVVACLGVTTASVWQSVTGSSYQPADQAARGRRGTTTTTTTITYVTNPFQRFFGAPRPPAAGPVTQGGYTAQPAPPPAPQPVSYNTMTPPYSAPAAAPMAPASAAVQPKFAPPPQAPCVPAPQPPPQQSVQYDTNAGGGWQTNQPQW